jgi:hypothetical protein
VPERHQIIAEFPAPRRRRPPVVGVGIEQGRLLVEHHLLQDGAQGFALGKPLPPIARKRSMGLRPVERQEARGPSIGDAEPVQIVEHARKGDGRKAQNGNRAKMTATDCWRKSSR